MLNADRTPNVDPYVRILLPHFRTLLSRTPAGLADAYYYASLPLCVMDAVFSLGIQYRQVENLIDRYCTYFRVPTVRSPRHVLPRPSDQLTISQFVAQVERVGLDRFTNDILKNRTRTSTQGGILKSEASLQFARVLKAHGIEVLQDMETHVNDRSLEADLSRVRGQGSGISITYFFMLSGSDQFIKPDRMIMRFLERHLLRRPSLSEAQFLFSSACEQLRPEYPGLTPRALDYVVWQHRNDG